LKLYSASLSGGRNITLKNMLSEQQVFNAVYDSTNTELNATSAAGTIVGNAPQGLRSEQNILNSAFDGVDSFRFLFT